jgi:hypothetical protein
MKLGIARQTEPTISEIKIACGLENISDTTLRRRLNESGEVKSKQKKKKPFVSDRNRKIRKDWCKYHLKWPNKRWRQVIWSDESPFVFRFNRKTKV